MKSGPAVALLIALLVQGSATAGEVIAHATVTLSGDEIRDVFLGEKQLDGNLKLVPVDNTAIQPEFLSRVLQTDAQKYSARWTKKTFREGLAPPARKGSDAEVVEFVRTTPGAVGYVSRPWPGVKVLEKF
jgi:ABC-type phosphate transport system substrate-binding protein